LLLHNGMASVKWIKRFDISFQCFRKAKVTKYAYLLPHFCLFAFYKSSADLKKWHEVWYWEDFDVLLTVHISIILAIDQLNAQIIVL